MSSLIGPNEIRVVIRPVEARDYDLGQFRPNCSKKRSTRF